MKVFIGPYLRWIGPYQIADMLMFWSKDEDKKHNFGRWLANDKNGNDSWLTAFCNWIYNKRSRTVKVRIDRYDVWSLDHTLSAIIVPALELLKKDQHGTPYIEDEDVPDHLKTVPLEDKESHEEVERHYNAEAWQWILDEMIWSFKQVLDDDWEDQYKINGNWDFDGMRKHTERMQRGFMLFGKYYRNLWS